MVGRDHLPVPGMVWTGRYIRHMPARLHTTYPAYHGGGSPPCAHAQHVRIHTTLHLRLHFTAPTLVVQHSLSLHSTAPTTVVAGVPLPPRSFYYTPVHERDARPTLGTLPGCTVALPATFPQLTTHLLVPTYHLPVPSPCHYSCTDGFMVYDVRIAY